MRAPLRIPNSDVRVWTVPLTAAAKPDRRREAHRALLLILAGELECDPGTIDLARGTHGKPHLPGHKLEFNLSHCERFAMVAVADTTAVGVDVERVRTFANERGMRRRICSAREQEHLALAAPPAASAHELIRLWVRKEAVVKACGLGITGDLSRIEALQDLVHDWDGIPWHCVDLPAPEPGHVAAVAFAVR